MRNAVAGLLAILLLPAGTAAAQPGVLDAGPLVPVSVGSPFAKTCALGAIKGYMVEPSATTLPGTATLVAAWQLDRTPIGGADAIGVARSADGGAMWTAGVAPGLSKCSGGTAPAVSDPFVAAGPDGIVYLSSLTVRGRLRFASDVQVSRSTDGGATFGPPVVVAADRHRLADKPTVAADPAHPGVAYVVWVENVAGGGFGDRRPVIARTTDGGLTWSAPRQLPGPGRGARQQFPSAAVAPDGDVVVVAPVFRKGDGFDAYGVARFRFEARTSHDGGLTWSASVRAQRLHSTYADGDLREGDFVPVLASGPGGVYLVSSVWQFDSGMSGLTITRRRADGRWDAPSTIADVPGFAFLPTVAAGGDGGLAVTWDEVPRHGTRGRLLATVRAAVSRDGGATWTERALARPFDLRRADLGERFLFLGDYEALTPTPDGFTAVYARPSATTKERSVVYAQRLALR